MLSTHVGLDYAHICTCTYTRTHTHIHMHTHAHTHTNTHTHIYTNTRPPTIHMRKLQELVRFMEASKNSLVDSLVSKNSLVDSGTELEGTTRHQIRI